MRECVSVSMVREVESESVRLWEGYAKESSGSERQCYVCVLRAVQTRWPTMQPQSDGRENSECFLRRMKLIIDRSLVDSQKFDS